MDPLQFIDLKYFGYLSSANLDAIIAINQTPIVYSQALHKKRSTLAFILDIAKRRLEAINPHTFAFLQEDKKTKLKKDIRFIQYLLNAQLAIDKAEARHQQLPPLMVHLQTCTQYLEQLSQTGKMSAEVPLSAGHARYTIAQTLGQEVVSVVKKIQTSFQESKTHFSRNTLSFINSGRLYWVFTGSFLQEFINYFPQFHSAENLRGAPGIIPGMMSWSLYFTRFFIECALVLKHTIKNPWMTKEEKQAAISFTERFKTQWSQRKYLILNDFVWGIANFLCYFWLIGDNKTPLGKAGNVLTSVLFFFDFMISCYRLYEESEQNKQKIMQFQAEINQLKSVLGTQMLEGKPLTEEALDEIKLNLQKLKSEQQDFERSWRNQKYRLILDITYSGTLAICFTLALFPPAAMIPVICQSICFSLGLIYNLITTQSIISEDKETLSMLLKKREDLIRDFRQTPNENLKKMLYLEMLELDAQTDHQRRVIQHKRLNLAQNLMMDLLIPIGVLALGLTVSTPIGLGAMACVIAIGLILKYVMKRFEPQYAGAPKFDEEEYQAFVRSAQPLPATNQAAGFFAPRPNIGEEEANEPLLNGHVRPAR